MDGLNMWIRITKRVDGAAEGLEREGNDGKGKGKGQGDRTSRSHLSQAFCTRARMCGRWLLGDGCILLACLLLLLLLLLLLPWLRLWLPSAFPSESWLG